MNLAIDVGNTFTKIGVFHNGNLIEARRCLTLSLIENIQSLTEKHPIQKGIVAFVKNLSDDQHRWLQNRFEVIILDPSKKLPFHNKYSTPKTLGMDRVALVAAAVKNFPNRNSLIIDAGTCITYDFLNTQREYFGGAISPGLRMRYEAMNKLTAALPLLDSAHPKNLIGSSTEESMHSGVYYGIINEIEGFITMYQNKYDDLTVILTGGDSHFLRDSLKNDIFANPNFLLEGLNHILEFN